MHMKAAQEKIQFEHHVNMSIDLFDAFENTDMLLQILVNVCLDGNYYFLLLQLVI